MPRQSYPSANGGDGAYIFDSAGKRYLDASGGAAVSCLGTATSELWQRLNASSTNCPLPIALFSRHLSQRNWRSFLGKPHLGT
jgi:acetylornithine/succinyldiaminopimelate/putrescine aminotransferase